MELVTNERISERPPRMSSGDCGKFPGPLWTRWWCHENWFNTISERFLSPLEINYNIHQNSHAIHLWTCVRHQCPHLTRDDNLPTVIGAQHLNHITLNYVFINTVHIISSSSSACPDWRLGETCCRHLFTYVVRGRYLHLCTRKYNAWAQQKRNNNKNNNNLTCCSQRPNRMCNRPRTLEL